MLNDFDDDRSLGQADLAPPVQGFNPYGGVAAVPSSGPPPNDGEFQPPATPQFVAPDPLPTFTQADNLAIQRYQNALASVKNDVQSGQLHRLEGARAGAMIQENLQPLLAEREKARQQAIQDAAMQAAQQEAMAASIQQS